MWQDQTPEDLQKAMKKEHTTGGVSQDKFTVSGTMCVWGLGLQGLRFTVYRGTSLIRTTSLLGPNSRTVPRALWWS